MHDLLDHKVTMCPVRGGQQNGLTGGRDVLMLEEAVLGDVINVHQLLEVVLGIEAGWLEPYSRCGDL